MNRLTHSIENDLNDNMEQLTQENIKICINDYDNINEVLEFGLIQFIKNNVKKQYKIKRVLPNSLNCEISFIENNS
jgi:ubiquinone/menaquinone biosynthesis C-methylase UbiE